MPLWPLLGYVTGFASHLRLIFNLGEPQQGQITQFSMKSQDLKDNILLGPKKNSHVNPLFNIRCERRWNIRT